MMVRLFVILISILSFSQYLIAQDKTGQEVKEEIYKIIKDIRTLQCDFTQEKSVKMLSEKAVSTGKMSYVHDKKLRWEYVSPIEHKFILNGTEVRIQDKEGEKVVNVEKSRIFKEVVKMIKGDVIGESFKDGKVFNVECSLSGDEYIAVLTTQKNQLKRMIKGLTIYADKNKSILTKIELIGAKGDKTVLIFRNVVINEPVDEVLFSLN